MAYLIPLQRSESNHTGLFQLARVQGYFGANVNFNMYDMQMI